MDTDWIKIAPLDALVPNTGIAALVNGEAVALFYLPAENPSLYAIDNFDPIGDASVLSRGMVGDIRGELVVASPLYKQHFSLSSGRCLEDDSQAVRVWPVRVDKGTVLIQALPAAQPAVLRKTG